MYEYLRRRNYPIELDEIAEKIESNLPPITWDDILDVFVALAKSEKEFHKQNPATKKKRKAQN